MIDEHGARTFESQRVSLRAAAVAVVAAWFVLAAVRLTAPSDLLDNDQVRPAMYALDAIRNGHWIIQTDPTGDVASKPPLYTWLVALTGLARGRVDEWALYLPTAMAMLATALIVLRGAGARFGAAAGLMGAGAVLFSPFGAKHLALARTDALFAFTVCVAAMLAHRAWSQRPRWGWTAFWLACAAATLTKGPLGVALAAGGLLAALWERRSQDAGRSRSALADHALGVALFLAVCGGWFYAAYGQMGQPLIDKMIGRELVGHVAASDSGGLPLASFYKPPLYFLTRFAPWCVPACIGLWRVFRRPAESPGERRFERFLACWFLAGMAVFCIAPHQRADLLLPLIPAAAMLAGREAAGWMKSVRRAGALSVFAAVAAMGVLAVGIDRHVMKRADTEVLKTAAWRDAARRLASVEGAAPRFVDIDGPMALQMFLQVHQQRATLEEAEAIARSGERALFVWRGEAASEQPGLGRAIEEFVEPTRRGAARVFISTNDETLVLPR